MNSNSIEQFTGVISQAFASRKAEEMPHLGIKGSAENIVGTYNRLHSALGPLYARLYSDVVAVSILSLQSGFGPMAIGFKIAERWQGQAKPGGSENLQQPLAALEAAGAIVKVFSRNRKLLWLPVAFERQRTTAAKTTEPTAEAKVVDAMAGLLEGIRTTPETAPAKPRRTRKAPGQAGPTT